MPNQAEVHAAAQALWDAARKLPLETGLPLYVAVEQALTVKSRRYYKGYGEFEEVRILRSYDDADPAEPRAWCGRLLGVFAEMRHEAEWLPEISWLSEILEGNVIGSLGLARQAVETVLGVKA